MYLKGEKEENKISFVVFFVSGEEVKTAGGVNISKCWLTGLHSLSLSQACVQSSTMVDCSILQGRGMVRHV